MVGNLETVAMAVAMVAKTDFSQAVWKGACAVVYLVIQLVESMDNAPQDVEKVSEMVEWRAFVVVDGLAALMAKAQVFE